MTGDISADSMVREGYDRRQTSPEVSVMENAPAVTMSEREFNQRFREVLDQVERGTPVIITRAGQPTVELRALPGARERRIALDEQIRNFPPIDREALERTVDSVLIQPNDLA